MSVQNILTMSQVRKIPADGQAEIVTQDAVIQPGVHSFANQDALNAYLVETFGARMQHGGSHSHAKANMYDGRLTAPPL